MASDSQPLLHSLDVHCSLAEGSVRLELPRLAIKPGDRVFWNFRGVPEDWVPWIVFVEPEAGFLGPFESLTQGGGGLLGLVRPELPVGSFSYRVLIQKGLGVGEDSETATLTSRVSHLDVATPDWGELRSFDVRAVEKDGRHTLEILPLGHRFEPGDWVEWRFDLSLLQGPWRPRISFQRYLGEDETPNLFLGPFTSVYYATDRVIGMGNNRIPGLYFFIVSVTSIQTGEVRWVSSGDPAIDSRGSVSDPGSTP